MKTKTPYSVRAPLSSKNQKAGEFIKEAFLLGEIILEHFNDKRKDKERKALKHVIGNVFIEDKRLFCTLYYRLLDKCYTILYPN